MMPVPTPPKKDLFQVTPPPQAGKRANKSKPKMRTDSKRLDNQIKKLGAAIAASPSISEEVAPVKVAKPVIKRTPLKTAEHLSHMPFRENADLRKLQFKLKKESEHKNPVKRAPKRRQTKNKTIGEK